MPGGHRAQRHSGAPGGHAGSKGRPLPAARAIG